MYKQKTRMVKRKCPNKTIEDKKISKIHFVVAVCQWVWGLPLSVVCISSDVKKAL